MSTRKKQYSELDKLDRAIGVQYEGGLAVVDMANGVVVVVVVVMVVDLRG